MCRRGETEKIFLKTGQVEGVDKCIVGIVQALNEKGIHTIGSCCGHGKEIGNIVLQDGRSLIIVKNGEKITVYRDEKKVDIAIACGG